MKIHGTDPKLDAPVVQLLPDLSSYDNLQNEGTPMIISLGILARNEAGTIESLFSGLMEQTLLTDAGRLGWIVEVICVPNGCTDQTAKVAERSMAEMCGQLGPAVRGRVEPLAEAGKANAWNRFTHELSSAQASLLVLLDADIRFVERDTLIRLVRLLEEQPDADVSTPMPIKDIASRQHKGLMVRALLTISHVAQAGPNAICGQLYAARAPVLRQVWMPRELLVEDGFLRAMIVTDRFTKQDDPSRIRRDPDATYVFDAYTSLRDLFHHERRLVMGTAMNSYLFGMLWSLGDGVDAGQWIRKRDTEDATWFSTQWASHARAHRWLMPAKAWRHRLDNLRNLPLMQRIRSAPVVVAASLFTLLVHIAANRRLKRQAILEAW